MKCCLCREEIPVEPTGWDMGHNPWPVDQAEGARCCAECNHYVVLPARMGVDNPDEVRAMMSRIKLATDEAREYFLGNITEDELKYGKVNHGTR